MVPSRRVREPLRVLHHPRVVRGGLQCQVEGDLQAQRAGLGHEGVEVVEVAQVRVDRVVAAVGGPDGPRRAGILRAGVQRVVPALAERGADGVDRRQVDHVEAHRGGGLEALVRGVERAGVPVAVVVLPGALRAGEELVPRRVEGPAAFHADGELGGGRDELAGAEAGHRPGDGRGGDELQHLLDVGLRVDCLRGGAEQVGGPGDAHRIGLLRGAGEEVPALQAAPAPRPWTPAASPRRGGARCPTGRSSPRCGRSSRPRRPSGRTPARCRGPWARPASCRCGAGCRPERSGSPTR